MSGITAVEGEGKDAAILHLAVPGATITVFETVEEVMESFRPSEASEGAEMANWYKKING